MLNKGSFDYLISNAYDCVYYGYGFESFCEFNKDALLIIMFETGDNDCPHWEVKVIVKNKFDYNDYTIIEDSFSSYLDSPLSDDKEFEEMVDDVLNKSEYKWEIVVDEIPECVNSYTLWI